MSPSGIDILCWAYNGLGHFGAFVHCSMLDFHTCFPTVENHMSGIVVGVLSSSVVDCGFGSKDNNISICCFSA